MCIKLSENNAQKADNIMFKLHQLSNERKGDTNIYYLLLKLLLLLQDNYDFEITAVYNGIIGNAISFIDSNLKSKISTELIAKSLNISKYYLCHSFRSVTGMTLSNYITEKKLTETRQLLIDSDMTVSEISEEFCFASISYFVKQFKARYGLPPAKYRKTYKLY